GTEGARLVLEALHRRGVTKLHGLGFKLEGVEESGHLLYRSDTMSWSYDGRYGGGQHMRLPGCAHKGPKHGNCLAYALWYRENKLIPAVERSMRATRVDQPGLITPVTDASTKPRARQVV